MFINHSHVVKFLLFSSSVFYTQTSTGVIKLIYVLFHRPKSLYQGLPCIGFKVIYSSLSSCPYRQKSRIAPEKLHRNRHLSVRSLFFPWSKSALRPQTYYFQSICVGYISSSYNIAYRGTVSVQGHFCPKLCFCPKDSGTR